MSRKGFVFLSILFITLLLSVSTFARDVTLSWDPNSEPDLSHYVVYWGTSSGSYSNNSGNIGLSTIYSVEIPDDGQQYFFAVTAVDEAGLESDCSNEVSTGDDTLDEYLYLPPAAPTSNSVQGTMTVLPNGTVIVSLGSSKFNVTLPNGTIIDIEGTTAVVRQ